MKKSIPESELILNPDGSVYHLHLKPENVAGNIILVGDPDRVFRVASFFETIDYEGQNREFVTVTGSFDKVRMTVMSTGMGPDNIDIVVNELDALVNIDLNNRTVLDGNRSLNLFRLGTSGAVQSHLPLNAVVVATHGLGLDGMMHFYQGNSGSDHMARAFMEHTCWKTSFPTPYSCTADQVLLDLFKEEAVFRGITATAPGFYGPQGRVLRLPLADPDLNSKLSTFRFGDLKILNYEMETAALYSLSRMLGHRALSVCLCVANRWKQKINSDYDQAMKNLIGLLLTKIVTLNS